jgi:hypothetical protein
MPTRGKIPGWFVGLVVLVTAAVTCWAMLRRSGGPLLPTDLTALPRQVTQVYSPVLAGGAQPVAANRPVPAIRAGSSPRHTERGPCTLCHLVVDAVGNAIPMIQAMASLPHQYRGGLCINCHRVSNPGTTGTAVGASTPVAAPMPLATARPGVNANPPAANANPPEGSWLGMEVVPVTSITAAQYGLQAGIVGLVVAEAEGVAATAGVRAGDLLATVNGQPVGDMQSFFAATQNGQAQGGETTVMRAGRFLRVSLGSAPALPAVGQAAQPAAGFGGVAAQGGVPPCYRR